MKTVLLEPHSSTSCTKISVDKDTVFVLSFGKITTDIEMSLDLHFEEEGISAKVVSPYKLMNGQKLKLTTSSIHKAPNTSCITKIKGVLGDNAVSDYAGKIIIEKGAHGTEAFLQDDVLVIGENVVNNTSPILEIEANDVKASHGATTGRVREDEMFYLMSRGLSRREAEDIIAEGFFNSILLDINDDKIKEAVLQNMNKSE